MHYQVLILAVITPHWAEKMWSYLYPDPSAAGVSSTVVDARFPSDEELTGYDPMITRQQKIINDTLKSVRQSQKKASEKNKKKLNIYVTSVYPSWQLHTLEFLQGIAEEDGALPDDLMKRLASWLQNPPSDDLKDKKLKKNIMQFAAFMRDEAKELGKDALDPSVPFSQAELLTSSIDYLKKQLSMNEVSVYDCSNVEALDDIPGSLNKKTACLPFNPTIALEE